LAKTVFIPGLLCNEIVFQKAIEVMDFKKKPFIADLTTQKSITKMAKDILKNTKGKIHVIGYSMGGRVAFEIVRLAPERVKSLVVMDTGIHPLIKGEKKKRKKRIKLAYKKGMKALAKEWLPPMIHPDNLEEFMPILTKMVKKKTPKIHENQIKALLSRKDASKYVGRIKCPTLVVVGRQDLWANVEQHKNISKAIPGSKLVIIEDAGHFAPIERANATGKILARWLKSQNGKCDEKS